MERRGREARRPREIQKPTAEGFRDPTASRELLDLFRRIRSPFLALALDVAHCELLPGGTAPFVRALADRIRVVQLSDNRGRGGADEHLALGEGRIDFAAVLRQLARIRFAGPLVIELFDVAKKLRSLSRLRALLGCTVGTKLAPTP